MTHRLLACLLCLTLWPLAPAAQQSAPASAAATAPDARARRVAERVRALEREAEQLAGETRTLIDELRKREIERDLRTEELAQAEAATAEAARALDGATRRLSELEVQRVGELPKMEAEFVALYKRGGTGYARLLLGARNAREFARAMRAAGALAALTEARIAAHRRTVEALGEQRGSFEQSAQELRTREAAARVAKAAADEAVAATAQLIEDIDSRRDLTAQYVGELRSVSERLDARLTDQAAGRSAAAIVVPLRPFRGDLLWPVAGEVIGSFGRPTDRLGGSLARSGIEIAAGLDTPVFAAHSGTVGFAGTFAGFGTLVILDHGSEAFSLYGYLGATRLTEGQTVEAGAEVGSVGSAPAGPAALYFELRVDGQPVDPVEWLKPL